MLGTTEESDLLVEGRSLLGRLHRIGLPQSDCPKFRCFVASSLASDLHVFHQEAFSQLGTSSLAIGRNLSRHGAQLRQKNGQKEPVRQACKVEDKMDDGLDRIFT